MSTHVHTIGCSRRRFLASAGTGALIAGTLPIGSQAYAADTPPVTGKAPAKLQPFDMADVELAESPFLHAQRMTEAYLLSLSPDRMLHNFRKNAGLEPKAPVYGGWESVDTWADIHCHGHTLGHFLSGCALAWRSTGDDPYLKRIEYVAGELAESHSDSGSGHVNSYH